MFISYSHKDEDFLAEFKTHLATLRRNGLVKDWSDTELTTGDLLNSEIKEHLSNADLVAFLVSADFLNSFYCFEVELTATLNRLEHSDIRIIPIIVRPCRWKDSALKDYLAATKDGQEISKYENRDDAWLEVVNSVEGAAKKYLSSRKNKPIQPVAQITIGGQHAKLTPDFLAFLNDTEVSFQHRFKENLTLSDIFVYPDLKNLKQEYDKIETTLNSSKIIDLLPSTRQLLILGSEQSGKTSLCKSLFIPLHNKSYLPLLCRGQDITTTDAEKFLRKLVSSQYLDYSYEEYASCDKAKVLIIDDFDKCKINARHHDRFLVNVFDRTGNVILTADKAIKFDEHRFLEFTTFDQFEILPFGHLRRGELIEKWNSAGRQETIDITELHNDTDNIVRHVDAIIRKNILPRKPLYILSIIQMLNTAKPSDYSLTSYGHCYQSLIQAMLKKINIKVSEFDLYTNYLSELSYYIFQSGIDTLTEDQLESFKKNYSDLYLIKSHNVVINRLLSSGILSRTHNTIHFRHRYVFYFYVSKYISDHIVDSKSCITDLERLCNNIHTELNANILIFLVHHTKDQGVIDKILLKAAAVFADTKEATLGIEDTKYLMEYIASISKLVLEQRNIDEERRKHLEAKDEYDGLDENEEEARQKADGGSPDSELLAEVNSSVRLVEIIGQILRNRHGSLKKAQLTDLCKAAYSSGLKFLNFFLSSTRQDQEHILTYIQDIFRENTNLSDEEISREARNIFLMLCYGTSYSVIIKIANSVGSDKLMPIFKELYDKHPESPAFKLIWIAIQLEFNKELPKLTIEKTYVELEKNPIAQRLLQEIVIQHLYLNHVDYTDRQWISSKLHLPMKSQRMLQGKEEHKK